MLDPGFGDDVSSPTGVAYATSAVLSEDLRMGLVANECCNL